MFSWNVNGIRALVNKGAWDAFIKTYHPDVLVLQEIKAKPNQINLPENGYKSYWYPADKPGYSGVALLSKKEPISIIYGLPEEIIKDHKLKGDIYGDPNKEGRVITAEFKDFFLVGVYTPNTKDDLSRLSLRFKHWDPAFLAYLKTLEQTKPVVACGDFNVAHTADDLANPKPNEGKKGFTKEERQGFQAFIDSGFIDTLRMFKKGNGYYTWWSHFANARARNVGWRIDYFLASSALQQKVKSAEIYPHVTGSDHCPTSLTLDL